MKSMLISIAISLLDLNTICMLVAKAIAAILNYASKRGGKSWDICKCLISKINLWTSLFKQVYDDETLTPEEEKVIVDAIKNQTDIAKLVDILKKNAKNGK